jgi:hypothetical protein
VGIALIALIPGDSPETTVITLLIAPLRRRGEGKPPSPAVTMRCHPVPQKFTTFATFAKFAKFARRPQDPGAGAG